MATIEQDLHQNDPSSQVSPQGSLLDYLLWDRLSKFWSSAYAREDREVLNAIYEACSRVIDAEVVRMAEINAAKGLFTCPVVVQRRWVRLDLNRYATMKAFLAYAIGGRKPGEPPQYTTCDAGSGSGVGGVDRYLSCMSVGEGHAAHWHIHFAWTVSASANRLEIPLSYPTHPSMLEIWRMSDDEHGRLSGAKLVYGLDFTLLGDGSTVQLTSASVGDRFQVSAGINFSNADAVGGRLPAVRLSVGPHPGLRTVAVPPEFAGFPVHLQIVRNPPPVVGAALMSNNSATFSTVRETVLASEDPAVGAVQPAPGVVTFPGSVGPLSPADVVFVFGAAQAGENAAFSSLHAHETFSFFVSLGAVQPPIGSVMFTAASATVSEIAIPNGVVPLGLNQSIDYLGHEARVFIGGRLLAPSEYGLSGGVPVLRLRVPISLTPDAMVRVDIQYTREYDALPEQTLDLHNHVTCFKQNAQPLTEFETFDDGGDFDFDSEETDEPPWGKFDSLARTSVLYLSDTTIDESSMRVYLNGVLQALGVDYTTAVEPASSSDPGRMRLVFAQDITGQTVEVAYRRIGSVVSYGRDDVFGGTGCSSYLTSDSLAQILGNAGALLNNFAEAYGAIGDPEALIEAVKVVAAGGNPMLTLFGDEFSDYRRFPVDAANQPFTAEQARALESLNTEIAAIPVLVDHPHRPTTRLIAGRDFVVRNGGIGSSRSLTTKRGDTDTAPGVWWCPVLVLDERTLAKTFGNLVGDVRTVSTEEYRNALIANHLARYTGPVAGALESAASVFLGSPIFQQDGQINDIRFLPVKTVVTVRGAGIDKAYEFAIGRPVPAVGQRVFAGQALASPLSYEGTLGTLRGWTGGSLSVFGGFPVPAVRGDLIWIELFDHTGAQSVWVRVAVEHTRMRALLDQPGAIETVVTFQSTVASGLRPSLRSGIRVVRPAPAPFAEFDGVVDSVYTVEQWRISTTAGESFRLPVGAPLTYRFGSQVRRGDAVVRGYAKLYDAAARPDWHWMKPEDDTSYQHLFNAGKAVEDVEEDQRFVTINPDAGGMCRILLSKIAPIPPRGTKLTLVRDDTKQIEVYTITGHDTVTLRAVPAVAQQRSGLATFDVPDTGVRGTYFELPPPIPSVSALLASPHAVGTPSLQLVSATAFPAAGRVGIRLGGGLIEVDYYRVVGNFLSDLVWTSLDGHEGLIDADGRMSSVVPVSEVVVLGVYTRRVLNPGMEALIKRRVVRDTGTPDGSPRLTEAAIDEYYRLFRNNSSVLELSRVGTPSGLRLLLEDVVPPSTTLVPIATHVLADVYEGGARDG